VYRVDRIRTLSLAGEHFRAPPIPEPVPYDHPAHPEIVATFTARGLVLAEVDPQVAPQLERHPAGSGELRLRFPPSDLDWWAHFFVGLESEVTVHGPPELRERLRAIGQKLVERYFER
jgi:predicted DNA-binding transcriptional regulator YafY